MGRNRVVCDFAGFKDYMARLDELGDNAAMKQGVEAGLKASKQYVNTEIKKSIAKSNLPAQGKYSHGDTEQSIDKNFKVDWEGLTGITKVGFDFSKSGMTSIFLIYGTPKMQPVSGLYDAIYGRKTKSQIKKLQKEAIQKVIKRKMEG